MDTYKLNGTKCGIPFLGGAVGYFSYDAGFLLEEIGQKAKDDLMLPDIFLGFYNSVICIDHSRNELTVVACGFPEKNYSLAKKRADAALKKIVKDLSEIDFKKPKIGKSLKTNDSKIKSNFSKEEYLQAIRTAKAYIKKGDIYQVNLSQRFELRTNREPFRIYSLLREVSPAPFSAYLDCGDFQVLSSSPERFLHFDGKKVTTRPMKGTRPRGLSRKDDLRYREDLLKSQKDKAELIMIVDLLRNDLGRVCKYGSIKVSSMRSLEKYSTVYQTTATIEGLLHKDKDRIDLLKACFPGGSITGCPKIRSMQIIEELEPSRRSIYTGSLGYFGFNNTMDLNILIRTILKKKDKLYFQVGGGIVADSKGQSEYQETLVKAQGIFKAIAPFGNSVSA